MQMGGYKTYASSSACSDIIGQSIDICRRSLQDDSFDLIDSTRRNWYGSTGQSLVRITTAAEGIVKDLSALYYKSACRSCDRRWIGY